MDTFTMLLDSERKIILATKDHIALAVFLTIKSYYRLHWNNTFPSYATIAKEAGVSESTVKRKCKILKDIGVLDWESRKQKHLSNKYSFPMVSGKAPMGSLQTKRQVTGDPMKEKVGSQPRPHHRSTAETYEVDNKLEPQITSISYDNNEEFRDLTEEFNREVNVVESKATIKTLKDITAQDLVTYCTKVQINLPLAIKELGIFTMYFDNIQEIAEYMDWYQSDSKILCWSDMISNENLVKWQQLQGYYVK